MLCRNKSAIGEVVTLHGIAKFQNLLFAELPGSIPGIRRPAHVLFREKMTNGEWLITNMIVEQDAADIGAKSYIWKYFADNSCHGEKRRV